MSRKSKRRRPRRWNGPKLKSLKQKSNLTYTVKAENLKSLCAHFTSCDYEKLLKKHTELIHGKIQQTLPIDGFLHHGFICSRIVVAILLHHEGAFTHSFKVLLAYSCRLIQRGLPTYCISLRDLQLYISPLSLCYLDIVWHEMFDYSSHNFWTCRTHLIMSWRCNACAEGQGN
jgi:hypothetical protein